MGGRALSTGLDKGGGRKQEEGYNAAVFSVSRVPRLAPLIGSRGGAEGMFTPRLGLLKSDILGIAGSCFDKHCLESKEDEMANVARGTSDDTCGSLAQGGP